MTTQEWMHIWFWWLFSVAASFAVIEAASWWFAHSPVWTLSDCVRRWQSAHHWIAFVTTVGALGLLGHFFLQHNRV